MANAHRTDSSLKEVVDCTSREFLTTPTQFIRRYKRSFTTRWNGLSWPYADRTYQAAQAYFRALPVVGTNATMRTLSEGRDRPGTGRRDRGRTKYRRGRWQGEEYGHSKASGNSNLNCNSATDSDACNRPRVRCGRLACSVRTARDCACRSPPGLTYCLPSNAVARQRTSLPTPTKRPRQAGPRGRSLAWT